MKKTFISIFFITIFVCNFSFADDYLENDFLENLSFIETSQKISSEPEIFSKNAIVLDRKTLIPIYEKNAYSKVPMASTTKILTCILALENCSLDETISVSKAASNVSGSTLGLKNNTQISMENLLYGLMLRSGNDCAVAIAEHISGSLENFSYLMNSKAFELGLLNSHFVTPHGLDDENHYTTAYDLALLTNYALKNETFKKIVSTKSKIIYLNGYSKEISNTNELLGNLNGVYGVKTGFTFGAGRCLVSAYSNNKLDIIIVVLGADTKSIRTKDSKNLINYISNNYTYKNLSELINNSFSNYLSYFNNSYKLEKTCTVPKLILESLESYEFPLLESEINTLNTKIYTITSFDSFVLPQTVVGKIELYIKNHLLCSVNILLDNYLVPNNWNFYFKKILSNYK